MGPSVPYADLHLHTNHSDGADAPEKVVARAARLKFAAIAITDHDALSAIAPAQVEAAKHDIEVLPGVEISTGYRGAEIHVLAYGIRQDDRTLQAALHELRRQRVQRAHAIVDRLESIGIPVSREALAAEAGQGAIGRLHIARMLYLAGVTKTVQEGFDRFIGQGRPAFVPKATLSVGEAIELVHNAGGIAGIAHPGLNREIRTLLPQLLALPFDAIEAFHVRHAPGEAAMFVEIAESRGLLITGGSDCHGNIKGRGTEMGKVRLAWTHYERLQARLNRA